MRNDNIDYQNLKKTKHLNPLFQHCQKGIPLSVHNKKQSPQINISGDSKIYSYIIINQSIQLPQKLFQCKSICPVFMNTNDRHSYILVRGENLWDYYRSKKQSDIIFTQEQIWLFMKQILQALIHLADFGYFHTHLKQYSIYRTNNDIYQILFHPQMKSMIQLSKSNQYYWYDFYLSPQQLSHSGQKYTHIQKDTVFSLGLMLLNVMNIKDFNRDVYSRKKYEVNWQIVIDKLKSSQQKYSQKLINLIRNCLKQFPEQRYGYKQIYHEVINNLNKSKIYNLQFKLKINEIMNSRLKMEYSSSKMKKSKNYDHENYHFMKSSNKDSPKSSKSSKNNSSLKKTYTNSNNSSKQKDKKFNSPQKQLKDSILIEQSPQSKSKAFSYKKEQKSSQKRKSMKKSHQNQNNEQFRVKKWKEDRIAQQQNQQQNKPKLKQIKIQQDQQSNLQSQINFRGTFGGQIQSPKFNSTQKLINKLKYPNILEENEESMKEKQIKNTLNQQQEFQRIKLLTFGGQKQKQKNGWSQTNIMQNQQQKKEKSKQFVVIKEQNDYQNSLYQASYTNSQLHPITTSPLKSSTLSLSNTSNLTSSNLSKPSTLKQSNLNQYYELLYIKQRQSQLSSFIHSHIQEIKSFINEKQKILESIISLRTCLLPIQTLQELVSCNQTPGVYIEGNIYYGKFKNGRRNGLGLEIFKENQYYFGQFTDDLFHGHGFYFWNKYQYFLGLWENGKKVFGSLYGPKLHYCGQFSSNSRKINGKGKAIFKTGQIYYGEWRQGKKHGVGQIKQLTNDFFIGTWQKGKKRGYGQFISQDFPNQGYKLKAIWKNQDLISDAIIQYPNGNIYQGTLKQFEKHGKGTYIYKKGGYFKGTFYKNEATHGQLVYKNGQKYIGGLKSMKRHGFGVYHYLDGTIKKGNWIEDVRVQKDLYYEKEK